MPKYYSNNYRLDFFIQLFLLAVQNKLNIYLLPKRVTLQNGFIINIFLYYYNLRKKKFFKFVRIRLKRRYKLFLKKKTLLVLPFKLLKKNFFFRFKKKHTKVVIFFTLWKNFLFLKNKSLKKQNYQKKYTKLLISKANLYKFFYITIAALRSMKKRLFLRAVLTHILFLALKRELILNLLHVNSAVYSNRVLIAESKAVYRSLKKNPKYYLPLLRDSVYIFNYSFTFFQPKFLGYFILRLLNKTRKHTRIFIKIFRNIMVFKQVKHFFYGFRLLMRGTQDRHGRTRTFFLQDGVFLTSSLRNPVYYYNSPCISKFGVFNIRLWLKPYSSEASIVTYVNRYIPLTNLRIKEDYDQLQF